MLNIKCRRCNHLIEADFETVFGQPVDKVIDDISYDMTEFTYIPVNLTCDNNHTAKYYCHVKDTQQTGNRKWLTYTTDLMHNDNRKSPPPTLYKTEFSPLASLTLGTIIGAVAVGLCYWLISYLQ